MTLPYTAKIIEYFRNPKNVGVIEDADATAVEGSPACGDMVKLYLKIDKKSKIIKDVKFQSYGCASNIATASIVTEMAKGKTIEEAKKISWKDADKELGGLPPVKVHCAVLAVDALHTAIENFEHKYGLLKNPKPTDKDVLKKRLRHVINPITGASILKGKLVKDYYIDNGVVYVFLNIDKDNQFGEAIKNDIIERLEPLFDVKEVKVIFKDE